MTTVHITESHMVFKVPSVVGVRLGNVKVVKTTRELKEKH